jgi:hypothetical protein
VKGAGAAVTFLTVASQALRLDRVSAMGFLIIAFALSAMLLLGHKQVMTGDEPRYLMYAYSIVENGRFVMTLPEWQSLYLSVTQTPASELPMGGGGAVLMNGVYLPTLLAPVARVFALAGLRAVTLIVGLTGLLYLVRLCRRYASPGASLLATGVAAFCIPLLPYLHLFYMETFLFALVCCVWERLQVTDRETRGDALTGIFIIAIPFVHLRGAVVAAVFFVALLWQQYARDRRGHAFALIAFGTLALACFIASNVAIYGAVTGPVNSARPPLPTEWFSVISMQSFNVRHGLIAYAPVWLLGYAGLLGGAILKVPLARQGLALALTATVTGVGINPGESWPARFWVLSVPTLAVGLCIFWELGRSVLLRSIVVLLITATLVNTVIFFRVPNAFLENRQTGATYQYLFDKLGHVDFGLMLPVETGDAVNVNAARNLAIGGAAMVVLLAAALARRKALYATPVVLLLLAAFDLSRVKVLPQRDYTLQTTENGFNIVFRQPVSAAYIQFGRYWQTWSKPPAWDQFSLALAGEVGHEVRELLAANQVIAASCASGVQMVSVSSSSDFDFHSQLSSRLVVYQSRSFLRNIVPFLRSPC